MSHAKATLKQHLFSSCVISRPIVVWYCMVFPKSYCLSPS